MAWVVELGGLVPVEEDDGGLEQVGDGGDGGVDDLPGQEVLPVAGDDGDEVADVVGVVVPVAAGAVAELVDQDRGAALGQEQEREARRDDLVALDHGALPESREPVLLVHQLLGAQAIPVVLAEEADAPQPAGPLQAVEIVELPLLAAAVILAHLEVVGHPVDPALEAGTDGPLAAVRDHLALKVSAPWNRLSPVMIRLEIPAQVMLAEDWPSRACRPSFRRASGSAPSSARDRAQTSGLTGTPASVAAFRPRRAYWVFELSPGWARFELE